MSTTDCSKNRFTTLDESRNKNPFMSKNESNESNESRYTKPVSARWSKLSSEEEEEEKEHTVHLETHFKKGEVISDQTKTSMVITENQLLEEKPDPKHHHHLHLILKKTDFPSLG